MKEDDGIVYIGEEEILEGIDSYEISYLRFDYQVGFIEQKWEGTKLVYQIDNPVEQELFVVLHANNERRNPCVTGTSYVLVRWYVPGNQFYQWDFISNGIANLRATVPAGTTQFEVTFEYNGGSYDYDFTVKTMAKQYAPIRRDDGSATS